MKMLVGFLIFSMLSGASELLILAAGDCIKGKLGRVCTRLHARQATTLARTGLMTGSEAESLGGPGECKGVKLNTARGEAAIWKV